MRRFNAVLTAVIMILFLIHGIEGGFQLMGLRSASAGMRYLAWVMLFLTLLHAVIGIIQTARTLRIQKRAGTAYPRENSLFWARRFSGFAILVFLGLHVTAFGDSSGASFRLALFDEMKLLWQLLLVLSIAVHVISNVKPMFIALGIPKLRARAGDILAVLSVILLFMAFAMVIYYLRWHL